MHDVLLLLLLKLPTARYCWMLLLVQMVYRQRAGAPTLPWIGVVVYDGSGGAELLPAIVDRDEKQRGTTKTARKRPFLPILGPSIPQHEAQSPPPRLVTTPPHHFPRPGLSQETGPSASLVAFFLAFFHVPSRSSRGAPTHGPAGGSVALLGSGSKTFCLLRREYHSRSLRERGRKGKEKKAGDLF